jgi:periplasmic divalent cation tolerance protein
MAKENNRSNGALQWLYVTAANHLEAKTIAQTLVGERLAACANILGDIQSVYWWDGEVQESAEVALVLKTRLDLVAQATARIQSLHSYDCPCVVALDIHNGNPNFLNWIVKETL